MNTFSNFPNRTFFGVDKGQSHSITVPSKCNDFLIQHFGLSESSLQKKIFFIIDNKTYNAEIRLARVLNIRPHRRVRQRAQRNVLKLQWRRFENTQLALREKFIDTRQKVILGFKNDFLIIHYKLIDEDTFQLDFDLV